MHTTNISHLTDNFSDCRKAIQNMHIVPHLKNFLATDCKIEIQHPLICPRVVDGSKSQKPLSYKHRHGRPTGMQTQRQTDMHRQEPVINTKPRANSIGKSSKRPTFHCSTTAGQFVREDRRCSTSSQSVVDTDTERLAFIHNTNTVLTRSPPTLTASC